MRGASDTTFADWMAEVRAILQPHVAVADDMVVMSRLYSAWARDCSPEDAARDVRDTVIARNGSARGGWTAGNAVNAAYTYQIPGEPFPARREPHTLTQEVVLTSWPTMIITAFAAGAFCGIVGMLFLVAPPW